MPMTRAEHLAWCKERAHQELNRGEGSQAISDAWSSMVSDLNKHPETRGHAGVMLGGMMVMGGHLSEKSKMAEFIDGFN